MSDEVPGQCVDTTDTLNPPTSRRRSERSFTSWSLSDCANPFLAPKSTSPDKSARQRKDPSLTRCGRKRPTRSTPYWQNVSVSCATGSTRYQHVSRAAFWSLYLFPQLHLTNSAVNTANDTGMTHDNFYSNALLDETGICPVSGTGFGQKGGEVHFSVTCLRDGVEEYVGKLERFHKGFMGKYKD
ncbi:hypothetical protein FRC06_005339 [Ceratobasidium sp. 370]|nr:hypothetical protein FRC06_005339 [Ceratobasidium sp. 370]